MSKAVLVAGNGLTPRITTVGDNEPTDTSIFRETKNQKSEHQKEF
jgi:hypothetical protein